MALTCWILSDGRIGTENNARGVAEALGLEYTVVPVTLRQPWRTLSPWLRIGLHKGVQMVRPAGPWPDLLITAGRTPAVGSVYIGQQSPKTVRIHITNPGVSPTLFDLVIAPEHDQLRGPNTLTSVGALHRVTTEKLVQAAEQWAPHFNHLPRPWHVLLVGGDTKDFTLSAEHAASMIAALKTKGGSVLVTASRRTSPTARAALSAADYLWDGSGENPYFGLLALADDLYVTSDSISMLSEAASTGKLVYIMPLSGHSAKHTRFHQALVTGGHAQFFGSPTLTDWSPVLLEDMKKATAKIRELLIARGKLSVI